MRRKYPCVINFFLDCRRINGHVRSHASFLFISEVAWKAKSPEHDMHVLLPVFHFSLEKHKDKMISLPNNFKTHLVVSTMKYPFVVLTPTWGSSPWLEITNSIVMAVSPNQLPPELCQKTGSQGRVHVS